MTDFTSTLVFQQLKPCIDSKGHRFIIGYPPAGQFGSTTIICERCGRYRRDLGPGVGRG